MLQWLSQKLDNILAWVLTLIADIFHTVTGWIMDFVIWLLDQFLQGIALLVSAIPLPSFLASGGLNVLFSGLDPGLLYLLNVTGFVQAVAILGAGVSFRLMRKIFTLGQW